MFSSALISSSAPAAQNAHDAGGILSRRLLLQRIEIDTVQGTSPRSLVVEGDSAATARQRHGGMHLHS